MKKTRLFVLVASALGNLLAVQPAALAKPREPAAASAVPAATADSPPAPQPKDPGDKGDEHRDNALVSIGHDSTLAAGEHATAVVSVLGSSTSPGQVDDAVVSLLGSPRGTGPVRNPAVAATRAPYPDHHVHTSVL